MATAPGAAVLYTYIRVEYKNGTLLDRNTDVFRTIRAYIFPERNQKYNIVNNKRVDKTSRD